MYLSDYFTVPMSLAGIPAISIPAGLAAPPGGGTELPVGLQIAAPAFAENRLLDAAHALERGDRVRGTAVGRMTEDEVREAAIEALDALPAWVREQLGDVAVIVEESHPDNLMGIYDPVGGLRRIVIFRAANPNAEEVRRTVWHEVGHHLGMDEAQLHELGYG